MGRFTSSLVDFIMYKKPGALGKAVRSKLSGGSGIVGGPELSKAVAEFREGRNFKYSNFHKDAKDLKKYFSDKGKIFV